MEEEYFTRPILDCCPMPDFDLEVEENPTSFGTEVIFKSSDGYAKIKFFKDSQLVKFERIEVDPDVRERGVGRLLVQAIFNYCINNDKSEISGDIVPINSKSDNQSHFVPVRVLINAYKSYGFQIWNGSDGPEAYLQDIREHFADKLEALGFSA